MLQRASAGRHSSSRRDARDILADQWPRGVPEGGGEAEEEDVEGEARAYMREEDNCVANLVQAVVCLYIELECRSVRELMARSQSGDDCSRGWRGTRPRGASPASTTMARRPGGRRQP